MNSVSADIHHAIASLLTEFYWRLDHGGGVGLGELFTPTGKFFLPKRTFKSPAEFERWATERRADTSFVSRHLWSNLRLGAVDGRLFRAEGNIMIFQQTAAGASLLAGNFVDLVEKGEAGDWRFMERRAFVAFEGAFSVAAAG